MKFKDEYILLIFAIVFFFLYSYISLTTPPKFISPDEVINHFYTELYAETGELSYHDDLNQIAHGAIRPRSSVYSDGQIAPQKYVGFPVVNGSLAVVIPGIIKYLTPLLAVVGAIFLYLLVRDVFGRSRLALCTALLLFSWGPYWYWSSLAMFENMAGTVMLFISLRYILQLFEEGKWSHYVLAGLFLGTALFIRPEYILFGLPLFVILGLNIRALNWKYVGVAILPFLLALGPLLILNEHLYGSFMFAGHHAAHESSAPISVPHVDIGNLFDNSLNLIELTPLVFICGVLGLLICVRKKLQLQYVVLFLGCGIALTLYFLVGQVLPTGLHSSYVRYFLPVYLLFLPFALLFLFELKYKVMSVLVFVVIIITSISVVVTDVHDNREHVKGYANIGNNIADATETDAVIFMDYWDKAVFPDRKVGMVGWLPEEGRGELLSGILVELDQNGIPVYVLAEKRFRQVVDYDILVESLTARGYNLTSTGVWDLLAVKNEVVNEGEPS